MLRRTGRLRSRTSCSSVARSDSLAPSCHQNLSQPRSNVDPERHVDRTSSPCSTIGPLGRWNSTRAAKTYRPVRSSSVRTADILSARSCAVAAGERSPPLRSGKVGEASGLERGVGMLGGSVAGGASHDALNRTARQMVPTSLRLSTHEPPLVIRGLGSGSCTCRPGLDVSDLASRWTLRSPSRNFVRTCTTHTHTHKRIVPVCACDL